MMESSSGLIPIMSSVREAHHDSAGESRNEGPSSNGRFFVYSGLIAFVIHSRKTSTSPWMYFSDIPGRA